MGAQFSNTVDFKGFLDAENTINMGPPGCPTLQTERACRVSGSGVQGFRVF